ncbi:sensor histidine kinase [Olivibacter sitiensis]|uniref:sensor histidine kinase n=1 Tax=Olivibacter sitiensis TaxID=376470 RepID=UPI000406EA5B|nr:HAMP domain-containing sensor histidine kinase [Olivibacter sitiensis]
MSPKILLEAQAKKLQNRLHVKEREVHKLLHDEQVYKRLEQIENDLDFQRELITNYTNKKNIYFLVYQDHRLKFWSSDLIVYDSDLGIEEGSYLIDSDNGYYEAIKLTKGNVAVIGLIPIKSKYNINNVFLSTEFVPDLSKSNNLDVASYQDREVYYLRNFEGKYLFSVKMNPKNTTYLKTDLELYLWIATAILTLLLVIMLCAQIAKKGYFKLSVLLLFAVLFLFRFVDLKYKLLESQFSSEIFNPKYYATDEVFPSLGAFMLNILFVYCFVIYVYSHREQIVSKRRNYTFFGKGVSFAICAIVLFLALHASTNLFEGLVHNSNISFDLSNILRLDWFSWIGVISLCVVGHILFLLLDIMLNVVANLGITRKEFFLLLSICVLPLFVVELVYYQFDFSMFICLVIIVLRSYHLFGGQKPALANMLVILLLYSVICYIKKSKFIHDKDVENMQLALQRIEYADDINAIPLFIKTEKEIAEDPILIDYFANIERYNSQLVNDYVRKTYFSGYLSKYEFGLFVQPSDVSRDSVTQRRLDEYRRQVELGAIKVSDNFYRSDKGFGLLHYFAVIPVKGEDEDDVGILIIDLSNRLYEEYVHFPPVLAEGNYDDRNDFQNKSLAIYKKGELVNQVGSETFDMFQPFEQLELFHFVLKETGDRLQVAYRMEPDVVLVLSQKKLGVWEQLASLSFLFLCFLVFALIVLARKILFSNLALYELNWTSLKRWIIISYNRILYSTRIKAIFIIGILFTLLVMGSITYVGISNQHRILSDMGATKSVKRVVSTLQEAIVQDKALVLSENEERMIHAVAKSSDIDVNIYGLNGKLLFSTQQKIYDLGFLSNYMDPYAYLNMNSYERNDFLQTESISLLHYRAVYAPIKDANDYTVAYLGLPDYLSESRINERIGFLLNTLINVYALVIVVLGLVAVYLARGVTYPLMLVQRSLSKTDIVKNNEPISWHRNDEIGALVKAYNQMIMALKDSASRLAQSERESAWREMAKQVAHEIKNPLTPLKLGVQLLERAWREGDPDFDRKFDRFSKSFIEQIDSLAFIASEFSNFAKMPEGKMQEVDICDVLETAIDVYRNNPAVEIFFSIDLNENLYVKGDRDQLLRSFNNLLKNAIEAGGNMLCIIDISVWVDKKSMVQISIRDNGSGIDNDVKDKIFQPNFTTKSSGTGLGLAFVKQTVEGIGGLISYSTVSGKGTIFYITIPLVRTATGEREEDVGL